MSLTVLMGDYGSGKTATAKYLAKQTGGIYLDVDMLSQSNGNYDCYAFADKLKAVIKPGLDYYLDGWPTGYFYGTLTIEILGVQVKYIVCVAAIDEIRHRQTEKAPYVETTLPRTIKEIENITHLAACIALAHDNDALFADTTNWPPTFWKKQDWLSRWMELNLYSMFKDAGEYQDIELSNHYITGLSKSYKTWERLDAMVDFRGKSVCDFGCNLGYFCFKVEEAGASKVIGVDVLNSVILKTRNIAMAKKSQVLFMVAELKKYEPPFTDIAMALNTLHHLDYDEGLLNLIFQRSNKVILEMPEKDKHRVDNVAFDYGFMPYIASSHREGRCIVVYTRDKKISIPGKYKYHPRREAMKWWLIRKAVIRYPLGVLFHLWRKLR